MRYFFFKLVRALNNLKKKLLNKKNYSAYQIFTKTKKKIKNSRHPVLTHSFGLSFKIGNFCNAFSMFANSQPYRIFLFLILSIVEGYFIFRRITFLIEVKNFPKFWIAANYKFIQFSVLVFCSKIVFFWSRRKWITLFGRVMIINRYYNLLFYLFFFFFWSFGNCYTLINL